MWFGYFKYVYNILEVDLRIHILLYDCFLSMDKISSKLCEACGKNKVRTLCYECREAYCQDCSDTHLRFKATRDHSLVDLHPRYDQNQSGKTSESTDETESSSDFLPSSKKANSTEETELSSDFLEHLTVTENTVLYRAQVAVEGRTTGNVDSEDGAGAHAKGNIGRHTKGTDAPGRGNRTKQKSPVVKQNFSYESDKEIVVDSNIGKFSIQRSEDKEIADIRGIVVLSDKIIVSDSNNDKLKLFDMDGRYVSCIDSRHQVWGITIKNHNRFATCGLDKNIYMWTLCEESIVAEEVSYNVDHWSNGIHYNGTYYCVLHENDNAITLLDTQGRQKKKIVIKKAFGKNMMFGYGIYVDCTTHNIYVSCVLYNDGVLCVSVEGEPLWFSPLTGRPWGITEIHGVLCVADLSEQCMHLLSKTEEYKGKLLDKGEMTDQPQYIYYDDRQQTLYFSVPRKEVICFVSVKATY